MRLSPLQHNLARLRVFLGLGQKELADLAGCKAVTIQSVELTKRKLRLSEDLAQRIATATGVACKWLMQNDLKADMIAADGAVYTKRHFEVAQSLKGSMLGHPAAWDFDAYALAFFGRLEGVLIHLLETPVQAELVYWKVNKFLDELEKEHGTSSPKRTADSSVIIGPYASQADVEHGLRSAYGIIQLNKREDWQAHKLAMKQAAIEGRQKEYEFQRISELLAVEQAKADILDRKHSILRQHEPRPRKAKAKN